MIDALMTWLALVVATLGLATGGAVAGGTTAALAVSLALIAASVVLLAVVAMTHPASGGASPPHPRRAIDVSSPLAQSDPDAAGHPRPRAPQSVAPAT